MTQEEMKLLMTDLCGRIQYNVVCHISQQSQNKKDRNIDVDDVLVDINKDGVCEFEKTTGFFFGLFDLDEVKPYLRPMKDMSEDEEKVFLSLKCGLGVTDLSDVENSLVFRTDSIDWLNEHHFDYRGLIKKGLALEATEEVLSEYKQMLQKNENRNV